MAVRYFWVQIGLCDYRLLKLNTLPGIQTNKLFSQRTDGCQENILNTEIYLDFFKPYNTKSQYYPYTASIFLLQISVLDTMEL